MDSHIVVETPESIRITYEIAGIGSRFVAQLADLLILFSGYTFMMFGFTAIMDMLDKLITVNFNEAWFVAIFIILAFLYIWGYFMIFESLWAGQTPGKKIMRLRVVLEGGYPATFVSIVLRNLVRIVDALPGFYMVGLISMIINRKTKRLGDYVAGTIVIKERGSLGRISNPENQISLELPSLPLEILDEKDLLLIRKFLSRRKEMDDIHRAQLARKIAFNVMEKMGIESLPEQFFSIEEFLEKILDTSGNKSK
ncbi:MAG: RDD family protein [Candidatus Eremiobacteraeota bacterium]|nr:RDD family protein [Candidatus Eremiobacteraeota bacterium]